MMLKTRIICGLWNAMSDKALLGNISSIWILSGVQGLTFPTPTTTTRTTTSGTTTSGTTTGAPKDGKS